MNQEQLEEVSGDIYLANVDWSKLGEYINGLGKIRDDGGGSK